PDGETAALPPAHVRFVPLDADHYALYWQIAAVSEQGYAVVRFDAGRMVALAPPADQVAVIALGGRSPGGRYRAGRRVRLLAARFHARARPRWAEGSRRRNDDVSRRGRTR